MSLLFRLIVNNIFLRGIKVLENRNVNDVERIQQLEKELEETILLGEESDRKFEEVSLTCKRNCRYINLVLV